MIRHISQNFHRFSVIKLGYKYKIRTNKKDSLQTLIRFNFIRNNKDKSNQINDDADKQDADLQVFQEFKKHIPKQNTRDNIPLFGANNNQDQSKNLRESSLQIFKISAEKIVSFNQMLSFYRRSVENQNFSQYFVAASIHFSRIIRRFKIHQFYDVNLFLGNSYEVLNKINLKKITIQQMAHIANLLNIIQNKCFLNTDNSNLKNFVHKMLQKTITQLKQRANNKHNHEIAHYREKSIACKMLRCSQIFLFEEEYKKLMTLIIKNHQDLELFDYLSIFNFLMRNNNKKQIYELEQKFLKIAMKKIIENKWIEISSIHTYCDLIAPIVLISKNCYQVEKKYPQIQLILSSMQQYLAKNYKKLSGQEVIRMLKMIHEINPESEIFLKLIDTVFECMKIEGQVCSSNIDPIFCLRLLGHNTQALFSWKTNQKREQKLILLIKNYFQDKKICPTAIVQSLNYIILSNNLSQGANCKLIELLVQIIYTENSGNDSETLHHYKQIEFQISIMKVAMEYHHFQAVASLLANIQKIRQSKQIQMFYLYAFMESISDFIRKNGLICRIERPKVVKTTGYHQIEMNIQKNQSLLTFLKEIYHYTPEIAKSASWSARFNLSLMNLSIQCLKYTLKYNQFLFIYDIINKPPKNFAHKLFVSFFRLSLPYQIQQKVVQIAKNTLNTIQNLVQLYFNEVRNSKNIELRLYRKQAQWFFHLAQKSQKSQKIKYYSDIIVLNFFLTFLPSNLICSQENEKNNSYIDQILQLCTKESNCEGILQTVINYYKIPRYTNTNITKKIADKIYRFMKQANAQFGQKYYTKQTIQLIQDFYWRNGGQIQNCQSDSQNSITQEEQILRNIIKLSSQTQQSKDKIDGFLQKMLFKMRQSSDISYHQILILLKIIGFLPASQLSYLKENIQTNLIVRIIQKLQTEKQVKINQESANRLKLFINLFILFPKLQIYDKKLWSSAIKLVKSENKWKGQLIGEQIFQALSKYIIHHQQGLKDSQIKNRVQSVKVLVRLFWHNPQQLYQPFMTLIDQLMENNVLKAQIMALPEWNYIQYLKNVRHYKMTLFSAPK